HEGEKIFAAHVEGAIDPGVEVAIAPEREVALEDHAIMAAQDRYNGIGELQRKVEVRGHGVLLPRRSVSQPPLDSRTPCLLSPCGCGGSRVKLECSHLRGVSRAELRFIAFHHHTR